MWQLGVGGERCSRCNFDTTEHLVILHFELVKLTNWLGFLIARWLGRPSLSSYSRGAISGQERPTLGGFVSSGFSKHPLLLEP